MMPVNIANHANIQLFEPVLDMFHVDLLADSRDGAEISIQVTFDSLADGRHPDVCQALVVNFSFQDEIRAQS